MSCYVTQYSKSNIQLSILWMLLPFLSMTTINGQPYKLNGKITDISGQALHNVSIRADKPGYGTTSNMQGNFLLILPVGPHILHISHIRYESQWLDITVKNDTLVQIILQDSTYHLSGAEITADANAARLRTNPLESAIANKEYLGENHHSSLMKSLEKLPGVNAMEIGQGFSKPVIRGLGFNRVVVAENGIKQQGQQWGADHGLEIDQFNVSQVEIVKGPVSLQYGSDAIGGVLIITPPKLKAVDGFSASWLMNGKSNNKLWGGSLAGDYQHNRKFIRARATYQNFADYHVPAGSFNYLNYVFPLHNGNLKNTAGREQDLFLSAGFETDQISSSLIFSNVHSKTGFFSGAHGIPTEVSLADDGDNHNIDFPYQTVNHFKVISNTSVKSGKQEVTIDMGYQNNLRREFSWPHAHGFSPVPEGNLELEFILQTFTANGRWVYRANNKHTLSAGISTEYQHNTINGYAFLLPAFEQFSGGAFIFNRYRASDKLIFTTGVRFDFGYLHTHQYTETYTINQAGNTRDIKRSPDLTRRMHHVSFGAGMAYNPFRWLEVKGNFGKSFRMPTANELVSNGVHHGTVRFEQGDSTLTPESSYQLDASVGFHVANGSFFEKLSFTLSGFTSYSPDFIFLKPTGNYYPFLPDSLLLPDAGQVYRYTQSNVFRIGGEAQLDIDLLSWLRFSSSGEYVYATDTESHFPIPFTPPLSVVNEVRFRVPRIMFMTDNHFSLTHRYAAAQNRVVPNERATPGYHLFDLLLSVQVAAGRKQSLQFIFQVQNLLDTKYYNHLSFYRYLDLPETGRNLTLKIQWNIN